MPVDVATAPSQPSSRLILKSNGIVPGFGSIFGESSMRYRFSAFLDIEGLAHEVYEEVVFEDPKHLVLGANERDKAEDCYFAIIGMDALIGRANGPSDAREIAFSNEGYRFL